MSQLIITQSLSNLTSIMEEIESHFPLNYSPFINALFKKLLYELENIVYLENDLIERLRVIWAYRGFSMESHFAKEQNYQKFDFYPKYKKLLHFDSLMIRKTITLKQYSKIIFIGSGPLPLSLKLLRIPLQKVGYDISKEAIGLAKKAVPKDRFGRKIVYKHQDFFQIKLNDKKPLIIYIAGLIQGKISGIKQLISQVPKGSIVIVRTVANDKRNFFYERVDKRALLCFGEVKEFIPTCSSGIVNGMIIIKKK